MSLKKVTVRAETLIEDIGLLDTPEICQAATQMIAIVHAVKGNVIARTKPCNTSCHVAIAVSALVKESLDALIEICTFLEAERGAVEQADLIRNNVRELKNDLEKLYDRPADAVRVAARNEKFH